MLLFLSVVDFFLLLISIILYEYVTVCLSILLLIDIWALSTFFGYYA